MHYETEEAAKQARCTVPLYHLHEAYISSNSLLLLVSLNILVIVLGVLEGPNAFSYLLGL